MEEHLANDRNIFQYDLASGEINRLTYLRNEFLTNLSISPDGRHIVFERHHQILNPKRDLWIMDRLNPVDIWPLTENGKSGAPDWSRTTVKMPESNVPDDNPAPSDNPEPSNPSNSGGGGCFLSLQN